jgi:putative oxidoreductase
VSEMTTPNMPAPRLIIPALGGFYGGLSAYAEPLLRFVIGAILVPHGLQKIFYIGIEHVAQGFAQVGYQPSLFWAWAVALTEASGGALLAVGLLTRPVALAVVIFMINAVWFTAHRGGFFDGDRGCEYALLIGFVALFFLIRGGGKLSLDRALGWEF